MSLSRWSKFALQLDVGDTKKDIPIEVVWNRLVDWPDQSNWMMQTKVWSDANVNDSKNRSGVGERIWAFTGARAQKYPKSKIGVLDEMVVVEWQPPTYCRVEHVGRIIKGIGDFRLEELEGNSKDGKRVRFHWYEEIVGPIPLLILLRPAILLGAWISLRRFRSSLLNR